MSEKKDGKVGKKQAQEMRRDLEERKTRDKEQLERSKAFFPDGVLKKVPGAEKVSFHPATMTILEMDLLKKVTNDLTEILEAKNKKEEAKRPDKKKAAKISVESKQKTVEKWKAEFQLAYNRANDELKRKKQSGKATPEATVNKSKLINSFILSHPNPKKTKRNPKPKKVYPGSPRSYYTFMEDKTMFP